MLRLAAVCISALLLSACGTATHPTVLRPPAPTPTPSPSVAPTHRAAPTPPATGPHFATPEAAMRYLAAAWNNHDLVSLKHVTDPNARNALEAMRSEAANLRLDHCTFMAARGDYECYFQHGFPAGYHHTHPLGAAEFTVGPAARPGWYMTYFVGCGGS